MKLNYLLTLIVALTLTISNLAQTANSVAISTETEIKSDIEQVPCNNKDRLEAVKNLFKAKGATDEDIKIENIKDVENLIVTKKGKSEEIIIIGAHYDNLKSCGAIDNWTGIVLIANIYRTIKSLETEKTYLFVAFGKEELGLIGSAAMAKAIPKEKKLNYCSMVNLDSFGFTYPQVLDNASNSKMTKMAELLAKDLNMPFAHASISGADSDSTSFNEKDIPAISFHGLSGDWQKYLHSSNDKVSNINIPSVFVAYQFVLRYVAKLDSESCGVFRKQQKPKEESNK